MLRGKVLITGGAGFLGRGILRKAAREKWDTEFTIYSRDEFKQYLCRDKYPSASYVLGDIRDTERLALAMRGHDVVIHAAALKFVPEAEHNVNECVNINVGGTQSVVTAAREARVRTVVAISTDKAVEPINTYGFSKALAERIIYEASVQVPATKFVSCRYGNVIGSTGSVVPVFERQLAKNGYIKVTDPNMTRFWLGIDTAVTIVEAASELVTGSMLVHIPKASTIGAVANRLVEIAKPDFPEASVRVMGKRPGEKMHEKLLTASELSRCVQDNLYELYSFNYHPDRKYGSGPAIDATSDNVNPMAMDEFFDLARDAEEV